MGFDRVLGWVPEGIFWRMQCCIVIVFHPMFKDKVMPQSFYSTFLVDTRRYWCRQVTLPMAVIIVAPIVSDFWEYFPPDNLSEFKGKFEKQREAACVLNRKLLVGVWERVQKD